PCRHRLLPVAVIERARHLALPIKAHRSLLEPAHHQHCPQQPDAIVESEVSARGRLAIYGGVIHLRRHLALAFRSRTGAGSPSGPLTRAVPGSPVGPTDG